MQIKGTSPCKDCLYRKDAPLQKWGIEEFNRLLETENSTFGTVYGCYKKDDTVCKGWIMIQDKNNLPSIALRIKLSKDRIDRSYFAKLKCKVPLFDSVEEMCFTNYPILSEHYA